MSTGEKERRVINRAVRVLDEIETRIHELREELEEQGIATGRGRKGQRNAAHDSAEGDGGEHEPQAKGRGRKADTEHADDKKGDNLHGAAKAAHDDKKGDHKGDEGDEGDDEHEPHGQGRVRHPESDHRLKANRGDHAEGDAKGNQDDKDKGRGDNLHGAAKAAHDDKKNNGNGNGDKKGDNLHGAAKAAHDEKAKSGKD